MKRKTTHFKFFILILSLLLGINSFAQHGAVSGQSAPGITIHNNVDPLVSNHRSSVWQSEAEIMQYFDGPPELSSHGNQQSPEQMAAYVAQKLALAAHPYVSMGTVMPGMLPTTIQDNGPTDNVWDILFNFQANAPTTEFGAVETDGTFLYVGGYNYGGQIYKYTQAGALVSTFAISGWPGGVTGIWSMTSDGAGNYYAVGYTNQIIKFSMTTQAVISVITPTPAIGGLTFIGYDPTLNSGNGGFWTGSTNSIYKINLTGAQIAQVPAANITGNISGITGCVYDPYTTPGNGNQKIWFFAQDGANHVTLHQFNPATNLFTGVTHDAIDVPNMVPGTSTPTSLSGGCAGTITLFPGKFVLVGIAQHSLAGTTHSPVWGYELANTYSFTGDIGVTALVSPVSGLTLTSTETVTVTIHNYGTASANNFPVYFSLQGGPLQIETYTGPPIAGGNNATFTFLTHFADLAFYGNFSLTACTNMALDQNTGNDCKTFTVTHNLASGTTTIYPSNIPYWTGSCNGTTVLTNSLITWGWPTGGNEVVGWAKFDLSSIAGATSVANAQVQNYEQDPWYYPYYYIRHLTIDPVISTPANIYSFATSDPIIGTIYAPSAVPNAYRTTVLPAASNLDILNAIPTGWYAIAFDDFDGSTFYGSSGGWNEANKPKLIVDVPVANIPHNVGVSNLILDPYAMPIQYSPKCVLRNYGTSAETNIPIHITGPGGYDAIYVYTGTLGVGQTTTIVFPPYDFPLGTNMCFTACSQMVGDMSNFDDCATGCMEFDAVLTMAYGYILTGTSMVTGPAKFSIQHPNAISSLALTTTQPISGGAWANNKWYACEYLTATNTHGHLYWINTATGVMNDIGPLGVSLTAMAFDHTTNTMYGIGFVPASLAGYYVTKLYTINLSTGAATLVNTFGQILGIPGTMAVNNAGMIFVDDLQSNSIWAIDPTYFTVEKTGNTNLTMGLFLQSATFNKTTDKYYHAAWLSTSSGILYDCNPGSAAMTNIGAFQGNSEISAFAIPFAYSNPTLDIGAMWLEYPKSGSLTTQEAVQVKLRNYGSTSVHNFDICYKLNNNAPVCENWWNNMYFNLDAGMSMSYVFSTYLNLSAPGCNTIKAWVNPTAAPYNLPDLNRVNDTVSKYICNTACSPITCFTGSIQEAENCGDDLNGGCQTTPNAFVDVLNGQTYCGTTWKIDTLRDTDWYRFVITGAKKVSVVAKNEMDCDYIIVKLPCSALSVQAFKTITKCSLPSDSLVTGNLSAGTYALIVAHNWSDYTTTCQNNDKYSFTIYIRPAKPCIPYNYYGGTAGAEYITNVSISGQTPAFSNTSAWETGGYADYTSTYPCAHMLYNNSYAFSLTNGVGSTWWTDDYFALWIDWNQNVFFGDVAPIEKITLSPNPGNTISPVITGTIVVPTAALPGPTILRCRITFLTALPDPCNTETYGEVEDYCVIIENPIPPVNTSIPATVTGTCPGQKIIPITVQNCLNVTSIMLTLQDNVAASSNIAVQYVGYQNVNPQLTGPITVTFSSNPLGSNTILINWFNATTPANIPNGVLLELIVNVPSGTSSFTWLPGPVSTPTCQYINTTGPIANCTYAGGTMTYGQCQSISGRVRYKHFNGTTLYPYFFKDSVEVILKQGTSVMYVTQVTPSVDSGKYTINNIALGTYTVTARCNASTTWGKQKKWGGINSTDALSVLRNFVGIPPVLTGLQLDAANVNGSPGVANSADALAISKRFVGSIPDFLPPGVPSPGGPDWYFESYTMTVNGTVNQTQNLFGLCAGDVNGSYVPLNTFHSLVKAEPTVSMKTQGSLALDKSVIDVPVFTENAMNTGAVSLVLNYPENLEVIGVSIANSTENLVWAANKGTVRIGWASLEPLQLKAGDVLLTLKVKAKSITGKDMIFSITDESQIAYEDATVIDNASLFMPKLVTGINSDDYSLSNYPNPFSNTTEIRYSMPAGGHVVLKVYNVLGEEVATLVNTDQAAGVHSVVFNGSNLKRGVYIYKLEVNDVTKVNSMIISE